MPYRKKYTRRMPYRKPVRKYKKKRAYRKKTVKKFVRSAPSLPIKIPSTESQQDYLSPLAAKVGFLTANIQTTDIVEVALATLYQDNPVIQHYSNCFNWTRVSAIKIELIPEVVQGASYFQGGVNNLADGEKPRIHWINDEGSSGAVNRDGAGLPSMSIDYAESLGNKYHEAQFTKPFTFWVKPYYRDTTGSDAYTSMNLWKPAQNTALNNIPLENFFYGFSNIPTEFKYKTVINFYTHYKSPFYLAP